ncbi:exosortase K [Hymenobacter metallilatus]|uniref:Exosortase K n=1 Tax=Hymenobacter metallilatus TaxID=2493666 RepID=A0A3R9NG89_9BACT|nr:exosortase K [Hymenobacter metallilatus]RSK33894.1 exosortase K [Hymenobacter metallilatus]
MSMPARWPYYAAALAVFLAAKLLYAHATTAEVRFLLAPTNALVSLVLNSPSEFDATRGYVHAGRHLVIDKSCAGGAFWLLSWLLLALTWLHRGGPHPGRALPALVAVSFGLTLLVNTARIVGAVAVQGVVPEPPAWLHEAQGALVYLFFLVASYGGLLYLLTHLPVFRAHSA